MGCIVAAITVTTDRKHARLEISLRLCTIIGRFTRLTLLQEAAVCCIATLHEHERKPMSNEQYIPKFTAQLSVAIPETPQAPTFEDFKNELKAYVGECFKVHGKEFDTAKSNQSRGDVTFYFQFDSTVGRLPPLTHRDPTRLNTVLELQASSYKSPLTADGFVSSFRRGVQRSTYSSRLPTLRQRSAHLSTSCRSYRN